MTWALHRTSLASHDLELARTFFGSLLGLGTPRSVGANTISFGVGSRGLFIAKPVAEVRLSGCNLLLPTARHVAIEVADLSAWRTASTRRGSSMSRRRRATSTFPPSIPSIRP